MKPLVIDISRYQTVESFGRVYAAGIRGVIFKATQGTRYTDPFFRGWLPKARAAGLLVACYHFGTSAPVDDQVAHFLDVADWRNNQDMMLALDFERNDPNPRDTMNIAQAKRFLQMVADETGQRPVLYSGAWIKQWMPRSGDAFFNAHKLWLAQYSERYTLPPGWTRCFLHQYTGDGAGPGPHEVDGIPCKGIDMNAYYGTDLRAEWIDRVRPANIPPSPPLVAAAPAPKVPNAPPPLPVVFTPASDGDAQPQPSVADRIANISASAAAVNELASQGSRIAQWLRGIKGWFWRGSATAVTGMTALAAVPAPEDKGGGGILQLAMSSHPYLVLGLLAGLAVFLAVAFYIAIRIIEKYLLTAARDGRYTPQ